jgi:uncharacterized membrane protein YgdD (TMEM256/DUF423 family)
VGHENLKKSEGSRVMDRLFFSLGSLLAFAGVALGAFAAHALKSRLSPEMLAVFEVGVRYHMYHALALLIVAWACSRWPGGWTTAAGTLFTVGICLFSGSLYLLSVTGLRWLGAVTPVGGLLFLAGWLCLAWGAQR